MYVNDLFIVTGLSHIKKLKEQLASRFKMKVLGHPMLFLGIELDQQPDYLFLMQLHYLKGSWNSLT